MSMTLIRFAKKHKKKLIFLLVVFGGIDLEIYEPALVNRK